MSAEHRDGVPYFVTHLEFITAVVKALNALPVCDDYYVKVELVEAGGHTVVGSFSDEIASDDWSYSERVTP